LEIVDDKLLPNDVSSPPNALGEIEARLASGGTSRLHGIYLLAKRQKNRLATFIAETETPVESRLISISLHGMVFGVLFLPFHCEIECSCRAFAQTISSGPVLITQLD
jgi:hypothetical protein